MGWIGWEEWEWGEGDGGWMDGEVPGVRHWVEVVTGCDVEGGGLVCMYV